ncbi:hypothetical protein RJ640_005100 [Escallonia rubra]|uniref:C3H1-type domain-containing protein n=1 Tax=Escallonia rubra TaxID=112253 RepID=A0AA88QVA9_9ASTE|nr:hypothetical protein RJ640_005100 [Escallonia rubra]
MANQLYGYNPTSYGGGAGSLYSSGSIADQYLSSDSSLLGSSRYLGSDLLPSSSLSSYSSISDRGPSMLFNRTDSIVGGYSAASRLSGHLASLASWPGPPGVDVGASAAAAASAVDPLFAGFKRPSSDTIYHQTVLGAHNTIGHSEAWFSANSLAKRPRFESASNLPVYPQRPGEKDCAHYMLTRTCKFGESCKFDHPFWVPEGGIPDWKEVPVDATTESLPERPGEPDCPTQRCKFGLRCKFNHPKAPVNAPENADVSILPERPSEPPCAFLVINLVIILDAILEQFYTKTGKCKFGATCKFHHPKDIFIPSVGQENGGGGQAQAVKNEPIGDMNPVKPLFTPALLHNSKGLPIRLGEVDCPFYLKTGSCKYGATCRYNHPDRYANSAPPAGSAYATSPAANLNIGVVNPAASILQTVDPRLTQTTIGQDEVPCFLLVADYVFNRMKSHAS